MNRTKTLEITKYIIYALILLLLYILQEVPGLFVLFNTKPIWVVSGAIAIAMFEGEFIGGIYGASAGILCDLGGIYLFGFNGFFVCICCIVCGLLVQYLMRCNVWGCLIFVFATQLICRSIEFLFAFGIWGFTYGWQLYLAKVLPVIIYSIVITPISYFIILATKNKFVELSQ